MRMQTILSLGYKGQKGRCTRNSTSVLPVKEIAIFIDFELKTEIERV